MFFDRLAVAVLLTIVSFPGEALAGPLFPQPLQWVKSDATGVAAADFNNDGFVDVVVPGRDFGEVRVHLGNGDGTFTTLPEFYVDGCPETVVAADFDTDGNVDLALGNICNPYGISVLLGNGDGTFGPETDYSGACQSLGLRLGDFNGDDVPDLICMGGDGLVALGNGDGTFATYTGPGNPHFPGVADFDGDGRDDYAYAEGGTTVQVELSDGDGTFTDGPTLDVGDGPISTAAGDVNGDALADLVVTNGESNDVSVLFGNGDGTFAPEQRHSLGVSPEVTFQPWYPEIADLDGDGLVDLVIANWLSGYPGRPSLSLLYGTGGGQFSEAIDADFTQGFAAKLDLADFDGDGAIDLVRSRLNGPFVSWLFGDGEGAFHTVRKEDVGEGPNHIASADLDGDGRLDLVTTNLDSDDVSVLIADGAGSFAPEARTCVAAGVPPCPGGPDPAAVAVGELTGDGHLDLAVANSGTDEVAILAGDGAGGFAFLSSVATTPGQAPSAIAVGDLDGDAEDDLVFVGEGSMRVGVLLGNGDGSFDPPPGLPAGAGLQPTALAVGLVDGDAHPDVVIANAGADSVTVLLGDGDGTFHAAPPLAAGAEPTDVTLGDVNGDAIADLAVTSDGDNAVSVFPGNGDGTFGPPQTVVTFPYRYVVSGPYAVRIADLDADGTQDLVLATGDLAFLHGHGDGTFELPDWYTLEGKQLVTGDFDLDGRIDVACESYSDWITVVPNRSGPDLLTIDADGQTLFWPAALGALYYDVYRGDLADLVDGDGDGLPDAGYGACMTGLDDDPRDTFFEDVEAPSGSGSGFFYLTSAVDAGGGQGPGKTSSGQSRIPSVPCP